MSDMITHIFAESIRVDRQYSRIGKDACCLDDTTQIGGESPLQGLSSVNILWMSLPALNPVTAMETIVKRVRMLMIARSMMFLL